MKRKILLLAVVMALVMCALAITVSAESERDFLDPKLAPERTNYQVLASDIIEFYDGFKCLTAYAFNDVKTVYQNDKFAGVLNFDYIWELTGVRYDFEDVKGFDIPEGVTTVQIYAGKDYTTLEWVTFPKTVLTFGNAIFQGNTGLKYCGFEHPENSTFTSFPPYMFAGCSNLLSVSMPDSITTIESICQFSNCHKLKAVYLSKNLQKWETYTGNGGSKNATFDDCYELYFVNEPFAVGEVPEKPEVYLFPSKLVSSDSTKDFTNECTFRNCENLNNVLVFDTGVTKITNNFIFQSSPANTVVFLGDVTKINSQWWGTSRIVLANEADKSADNVSLSIKNGQKVSYCFGADNTYHAYKIDMEATCTQDGGKNVVCFCGAVDETAITTPAYGHLKGALVSVKYENGFLETGYAYHECDREGCDVESYTTEAFIVAPIFANNGYSYSGTAILQGFAVNFEALEVYESTGKTLQYGLVVASEAKLGATNTLFDGTTIKTGAYSVSFDDKKQYSIFEMQITGLTEDYHDTSLFVCAYVIDGDTVSYISNGANTSTVESVTYNEVIANAEPNQKTDIIIKKEENA